MIITAIRRIGAFISIAFIIIMFCSDMIAVIILFNIRKNNILSVNILLNNILECWEIITEAYEKPVNSLANRFIITFFNIKF